MGSLEYDFQIHWSRDAFPIKVYVDTNIPEPLAIATTNALFTWNTALERQVFVMESMDFQSELPPDRCGWIAVVQNDEMAFDGLWRGRFSKENILCAAQVSLKLDHTASESSRNDIAIHEFGHALGLSHDEKDIFSVMHPKVWNDLRQHITPQDIQSLKDQYFL